MTEKAGEWLKTIDIENAFIYNDFRALPPSETRGSIRRGVAQFG